jgi:hypothetical protein
MKYTYILGNKKTKDTRARYTYRTELKKPLNNIFFLFRAVHSFSLSVTVKYIFSERPHNSYIKRCKLEEMFRGIAKVAAKSQAAGKVNFFLKIEYILYFIFIRFYFI